VAVDEVGGAFSLSTTRHAEQDGINLWLKWRDEPRPVEFFPDPGEGLRITETRVRTRGGLTRIDIGLRALGGVSNPPSELPALIVITAADGSRRAYQLTVDLS